MIKYKLLTPGGYTMTRSTDEIANEIKKVLNTQDTLCTNASKFLNSKILNIYTPTKTLEIVGHVTLKEYLCELPEYEVKTVWEV